MPEQTHHQLAAIMFTDIVGYTALMGEDEQKAIRLLDKNLSIQKPLIEQHQGKLLKEIGDGLLSSFSSVIEAVKCAIEIQDKLKDDPELNIRVGIHLGDVLFRDGDVLGDGVNIASRIESLASSGEILVSESVYNSIKNQEGIHTGFLKEEILKNVVEPVKIYKVSAKILEQEKISDSATSSSPLKSSKEKNVNSKRLLIASISILIVFALAYIFYNGLNKRGIAKEEIDKSIAVLPFIDLSEKGDQQFFADGVMEDILGQLQKMKELHVVSRTSVMVYRDNKPTISQIRDELKVSYVLEGSVRKSPDEVMITVQLINVADDRHLWSENYTSDYSAKGIFEIQGRIAKRIVNDLKLTISPEKVSEITQAMTENIIAYEYFQKGRSYMKRYTYQDTDSSIVELKKAIQIDPGFASAYGLLANAFRRKYMSYKASITFVDSAEFYSKKGLEFDDYCAECYKALAGVELSKYGNLVKQLELLQKALEINPNFGEVINDMISNYYSRGEYEKVIDLSSKILKVFPNEVPNRLRQLYQHLGDVKKEKAYFDMWVNKREINKLSNWQSYEYAEIQFDIGDVEDFKNGANRAFQTSLDSSDFHWAIFGSYWLEKKYDEVAAYYEENQNLFLDDWPPLAGGIIMDFGGYRYLIKLPAFSYLRLGKNTEASQLGGYWLEMLEKADKSLKWTAYNISLAYLLKNQKEQSVIWLERAIDSGHLEDISKDTFFESLKDHPSFQELVAKQRKKREEVMDLVATYDFPEPEDL